MSSGESPILSSLSGTDYELSLFIPGQNDMSQFDGFVRMTDLMKPDEIIELDGVRKSKSKIIEELDFFRVVTLKANGKCLVAGTVYIGRGWDNHQ